MTLCVRSVWRGPVKVYVESKDQIIEKRADSRGSITLGSEFANKEVELAVLEVDGNE